MLADRISNHIRLHTAEDPESGKILAGVVIFVTSEVAHAEDIATSDRGRDQGALGALFLALLDAPPAGCAAFDFGISNEEQERVLSADSSDTRRSSAPGPSSTISGKSPSDRR